jgi:hypothetical protein
MISDLTPSPIVGHGELLESKTRSPPPNFVFAEEASKSECDPQNDQASIDNRSIDSSTSLCRSVERSMKHASYLSQVKKDEEEGELHRSLIELGSKDSKHADQSTTIKHGTKWYEPSIGLWLWKNSCLSPLNHDSIAHQSLHLSTEEYLTNEHHHQQQLNNNNDSPKRPLLSSMLYYYSDKSNQWFPFTSYGEEEEEEGGGRGGGGGGRRMDTSASKHGSARKILNIEPHCEVSPSPQNRKCFLKHNNHHQDYRSSPIRAKTMGTVDRIQELHSHLFERSSNEKRYEDVYDDEDKIRIELKLAKLERMERIEMINKLIAEKELDLMEKELVQPKVKYFRDGLAYTTSLNNNTAGMSSDKLIAAQEKLNEHKKFSSDQLFQHQLISETIREVSLPQRTHIWCRSRAPGRCENGFRPIHFNEKLVWNDAHLMHVDDDTARGSFEDGRTVEKLRDYPGGGRDVNKKQFIHGNFTFHRVKPPKNEYSSAHSSKKERDEEDRFDDLFNAKHDETKPDGKHPSTAVKKVAEVKHVRDFEWMGRNISVEKSFRFEYDD